MMEFARQLEEWARQPDTARVRPTRIRLHVPILGVVLVLAGLAGWLAPAGAAAAEGRRRTSVGISNRPLEAGRRQQAAQPPRGTAKA